MVDSPKYWFPGKRYGWGWGFPTVWQGWAVLVTFAVLIAVGSRVVLPRYGALPFAMYVALLSVGLFIVCWIKGERPTWRWGGK
jgi:hypothetical protein